MFQQNKTIICKWLPVSLMSIYYSYMPHATTICRSNNKESILTGNRVLISVAWKKGHRVFFWKTVFIYQLLLFFQYQSCYFFVFVILSNCCYFYKSYHVDNLTSHSVICVCVWVFICVRRKKLPLIKKINKKFKQTHTLIQKSKPKGNYNILNKNFQIRWNQN